MSAKGKKQKAVAGKDSETDYDKRRKAALAMGGRAKLARRKAAGILNARERIDRLCDAQSFAEVGLFAVSGVRSEDRDSTPADGKVAGYGRIEGRECAVVSNDFTVKGASSSITNTKKIAHMKRVAGTRGLPLVFLGESSGARMPDTMGSAGMGTMLGGDSLQYRRMRDTPWAAAVLGYCYGSSAWYAVLSDFCVMRKGAVLAVSSPGLVSQAINQQVDAEDLGGWRLHSDVTGLVDLVTDTDEEALAAIRRFLSYLPSHNNEAPPVAAKAVAPRGAKSVQDLLPAKRTQVYDMRKVVEAVVDRDSFFELKARFGRVAVTGLARIGGRVVGVVANNPLHRGGALDNAACDKIIRLLVLCDSFNIPLVFFVDTPGFVIGLEAERGGATGKIMNFMNALSQCTVPKLSVILRKSYGQAYLNMGGGRNSDEVAAWPMAEISFMDPVFAANVVRGKGVDANDPADSEIAEEAVAEMRRDSAVWDIAGNFGVQAVIPPGETRAHLLRMLEVHQLRATGGVGEHLMRSWPTS